tara:strand:+ start:277 stop:1803 length:1527 start_codon:yes stop_codon:yes gene_type:complete
MLFYVFIKIFDFFKKEINLTNIIKEFFLLIIPIVILMYVVGYFTIQLDDGLGWGYGYYNFNLNSFFNPSGSNYVESFNWSQFFQQKQYQNGEQEGFAYLGITGVFFFLLFLVNFFIRKNLILFDRQKILVVSLLFSLLATSHNVNFGENNIFLIPINNLLYALLSSIRASGRLIWLVYYLIFIIGIIFVFKSFENKRPTLIILILFIIQIVDINPGLLKYSFGSQYVDKNNNNKLEDKIWNDLSNNFEIIRALEPENNSYIYNKLSRYLLNENFKKTDIAYLARVNRESLVSKKYELVKLFNQKDIQIFKKTIFVSQNINFVKSLYELYGDTLYFYYRDNFWLISIKPVNESYNNQNDIIISNIYKINLDKLNKIDLSNQNNSVQGIGWERNKKNNELTLDGYFSSLLINIEGNKCHSNSEIMFSIDKYYKSQNEPINLNIVINNSKKEIVQIKNSTNNQLTLSFNCKENSNNKIEFNIENPKSLYDLKKGLNRNKRSIILNSLVING